jgi:hypothetical protein
VLRACHCPASGSIKTVMPWLVPGIHEFPNVIPANAGIQ